MMMTAWNITYSDWVAADTAEEAVKLAVAVLADLATRDPESLADLLVAEEETS